MYIICVECSKTRGMGHFFRSLLYASYLKESDIPFVILINDDKKAIEILNEKRIPFRIVNFADNSDWETPLIKQLNANVWIQDKFETNEKMALNIKKNNILLCAIDEFGSGAIYCDLHFAGMIYLTGNVIKGKRIFSGSEYVILNPEINKYKKIRTNVSKVVVSLGGSDPFGMTIDIVREISKTKLDVEIIIGPDFDYKSELNEVNVNNYPILQNVPSLIAEFSKFDFAITGGGVTCCEANACGLPCLIIANAPHEINTAKYMDSMGGAIYGGSFESWNKSLIGKITDFDINKMSKNGMTIFDTKAIERIFSIIKKEIENEGRQIL